MISPASSGIKYGLIGGLLSVILSVVLYFVDPSVMLTASNYTGFVFTIIFMVLAGLAVKKSNDGFLSFGQGFMSTWLTYVIMALLGAIFSYVLFNIIDPDLSELVKQRTVEMMEIIFGMMGGDEDAMEEALSAVEDQDYTMTPGKLAILFAVNAAGGAIPAAIIALIIRKNND